MRARASLEYGEGLPSKDRTEGEYPVVGSHGIIGYHKEPLVSGPGIVVGRKGTIGAVSWIDEDFWPIDTTYYVKTKKDNVLLKWLFYELRYKNLSRLHLSDVVPGLQRELVYLQKIPFPPFEELKKSPSAFFGMCQAEEILTDNSKTLAITQSKQLVMPIENQLYLVNFSFLTEFSPVMEQQNVSSSLSEIYRSMGIHEYMEEVKTKRILEKLLSKTRKSRHTLGD